MEKLENNMLVICPNEQKVKILNHLQQETKLYNIKFMTKEEYLRNYFFSYQDKAILYLMKKYHYKVDVCKVYLKYLYVIDEKKTYSNKKLKFLQKLKKELQDNNLLEYNSAFKKYLQTKKKVVLNYPKLDIYEQKALGVNQQSNPTPKELTVTEYQTMEEEVNGVALQILELLKKNVDINKIYLTNVSKDYLYTIDRIFSYYKIPINIPFDLPTDENGIILALVLNFSSTFSNFKSPPTETFIKSNNVTGKILQSFSFSTNITEALVIGSFNILPVSKITFVLSSLSSIFITTSYIISFFVILVFTTLNAIYVTIKPVTPPSNAIFIGYVPMYTPFSIKISCGLTMYNNAKAHPPRAKDTK